MPKPSPNGRFNNAIVLKNTNDGPVEFSGIVLELPGVFKGVGYTNAFPVGMCL